MFVKVREELINIFQTFAKKCQMLVTCLVICCERLVIIVIFLNLTIKEKRQIEKQMLFLKIDGEGCHSHAKNISVSRNMPCKLHHAVWESFLQTTVMSDAQKSRQL